MQTHYFQRYHSKENVHTANATLLFARVYNHNPKSFFNFLESEILEAESNLDVVFTLQERAPESVPDAVIGQPSFKLVVETKFGTLFREKQLKGHLRAFGIEDHRVLITLDTLDLSGEVQETINRLVWSANQERVDIEPPTIQPIWHRHLRFRDLIERLEPYIDERDLAIVEMFADYKNYCHESGLIDNSDWIMLSVIATMTYEECRKFNLYFDVARKIKTYEGQRYLGLYKSKKLEAVGTVTKIVTVSLNEDETLTYEGDVTTDEKSRIIGAIQAAKTHGDPTIEREPYMFVKRSGFDGDSKVKQGECNYGVKQQTRQKVFC